MLLCLGLRCWMITKAMLLSEGIWVKNTSSASRPPADAPRPTMGKVVAFFVFLAAGFFLEAGEVFLDVAAFLGFLAAGVFFLAVRFSVFFFAIGFSPAGYDVSLQSECFFYVGWVTVFNPTNGFFVPFSMLGDS